jgi:hypothetical protein
MTTHGNIIKFFFFVIDNSKKVKVFAPSKPFLPGVMFVINSGRLWPHSKIKAWLPREKKMFVDNDYMHQCYKTFFSSSLKLRQNKLMCTSLARLFSLVLYC